MSKINISTASKRTMSKFDKSSTHITTLDVGQIRPTGIWEGLAGDKIHVNYGQFSRLSPLVVPTFGTFRLKTFFFNVPYSSVWHNYDFFRTNNTDSSVDKRTWNFNLRVLINTIASAGAVGTLPKWSKQRIHRVQNTAISVLNSNTTYQQYYNEADFVVYELDANLADNVSYADYYQLSEEGRWLFNILRSLGYELPKLFWWFNQNETVASTDWRYNRWLYSTTPRYSMYPLLSFFRCLCDYVYPSAYVNQLGLMDYFTGNPLDYGNNYSDDEDMTSAAFYNLFRLLLVPYDQSFFTALWQQPNQVVTGSGQSTIPFTDATYPSNTGLGMNLVSDQNDTALTRNQSSGWGATSAFGLRMLTAASDYIMRNNIGGARVHEWLRSHFGFATDEQDKWRSMFLKSFSSPIQISDVTSVAETETSEGFSVLGAQAGKGIGSDGGSLDFTFKEDGFLIAMSLVVPVVGYYQGIKPYCRALTDYRQLYLPEYDSVGFEGVARSSVFNSYDDVGSLSFGILNGENVFGFAPRYAERYKKGNDFLTGDFRFGTRGAENLKSYHTFRDVSYGRSNFALDLDFMRVDNQYNRIFNMLDGYDHILTIFQFDVTQYSHMLSIGESMPIFDKQGRDVTLDNQGTQLS